MTSSTLNQRAFESFMQHDGICREGSSESAPEPSHDTNLYDLPGYRLYTEDELTIIRQSRAEAALKARKAVQLRGIHLHPRLAGSQLRYLNRTSVE